MKSSSNKRINIICNSPGVSVWQRNYYEHVIRNDNELFEVRKYIENNPKK
jgi:REP element-mobilizing transposase RayT